MPTGIEHREALINACRQMLASMTRGRRLLRAAKSRSDSVSGDDECAEAMFEIRELMASLLEATPTKSRKTGAADNPVETVAQFALWSASHPPKPSWFEEDFRGLRGLDPK